MPSSTTSSDLPRVLIADDNDAMLARAAATLKACCDVVGRVGDGREALKAAQALHPDVVVLDISMPGLNGFEVAQRLRATGSRAAVVFLTVHDGDDFVQAALAAGGVGYVVKPRLASDLIIAVHEAHAGRTFISPFS
jgi:two-component system, NarL family, nitrate/nitrite response regulator NarL